MIIITSISPAHKNSQVEAVKSWQQYGECYSLNTAKEIEQLQHIYENINFIQTERTAKQLLGKSLVTINAMIDFAKEKIEDALIINSDIILVGIPEFKQDGITIFSRYDYINSFDDAKKFEPGFDVFFLPNKFLNIFPQTIYAMGACFWDHWLPYRAIINNIPIYSPKERYAFHKTHPIQYDFQEWEYVGSFFKLEFKLNKQWTIPQVATITLERIKSHLICL